MAHHSALQAEIENCSSADEVDNDFDKFFQSDANILGNILPINVWDMICSKVPATEMRTMSNASPYFGDLLRSKRTQFLLPDVLKPLSEQCDKMDSKEETQQDDNEQGWEKVTNTSAVLKCRSICKSWNTSVDQFIEATSQPEFFNVRLPSPNNGAVDHATYQYFGQFSFEKSLDDFMVHFEESHSLLPPSKRNPFIGHMLIFHIPFVYAENDILFQQKIELLQCLRDYGQHIRIFNITLPNTDKVRNHQWLTECLIMLPNLTHLKVGSGAIGWAPPDMQFGEHVYHPNLGRTVPHDHAQLMLRERRDLEVRARQIEQRPLGQPVDDVIPDFKEVVLPSLKCLKMVNIPAITFNALIQAHRHVEWLHIEQANIFARQTYTDWRQVEFPNLKTFYLQLNSPVEARQLWYLNPSRWGGLTHVHLDYYWHAEFFEWCKLFETIEEHWGNSLVELKLRLPKPSNFMERSQVMRDAVGCRLTLPKLKRLKVWIWRSKDFKVPLNFLETVRKLPGLEFQKYHCIHDH